MNFLMKKFELVKHYLAYQTHFYETSTIEDALRSSRLVTVRTDENRELVSRTFHSNTQASHDLNISRTSLQYLIRDLN